jgi:hypothetical protein
VRSTIRQHLSIDNIDIQDAGDFRKIAILLSSNSISRNGNEIRYNQITDVTNFRVTGWTTFGSRLAAVELGSAPVPELGYGANKEKSSRNRRKQVKSRAAGYSMQCKPTAKVHLASQAPYLLREVID